MSEQSVKEVKPIIVETVEKRPQTTIIETTILSSDEEVQMKINSLLSSSPE